MRVVFVENVPNVARAGEIKEVADGYGRNFLLPRKLAVVATPDILKQQAQQETSRARKEARLETQASSLAERLNGLTVSLPAKVGAQGRLYGSVTNAHIADRLKELTGQEVDRRRVLLDEPIRHLGSYPVEVRLTSEVSATINVTVFDPSAPAAAETPAAQAASSVAPPAPAEQEATPSEEPIGGAQGTPEGTEPAS